jgi:hypothetical protein
VDWGHLKADVVQVSLLLAAGWELAVFSAHYAMCQKY